MPLYSAETEKINHLRLVPKCIWGDTRPRLSKYLLYAPKSRRGLGVPKAAQIYPSSMWANQRLYRLALIF